jgi:hypothetical protein
MYFAFESQTVTFFSIVNKIKTSLLQQMSFSIEQDTQQQAQLEHDEQM